jgi:geranylgeranyl diphosphate/geranylgeranyl-bacteriochlorophyllide a reductase
MLGGELAADTALAFLKTGDARSLKLARKRFMRAHGMIFRVLSVMQHFWYGSDARRERFVTMCKDKDVQRLTWAAYTEKKMVRSSPLAHMRIFVKDMAHLLGIVAP